MVCPLLHKVIVLLSHILMVIRRLFEVTAVMTRSPMITGVKLVP